MPSRLRLCTIFLLTTFKSISCELLPCKPPYLCLANCTITSCKLSYLNLSIYHLANCTVFESCKLSSCKLSSYKLYHNVLQIVILQTIISKSCKLSSCKLLFLNLTNYHILCWAMEYGFSARGTSMDLKSVTSFQAHLDRLFLDDVS